MTLRAPLLLLAACTLACSGSGDVVTQCRDRDRMHPVCGFHNPEDLALVDDGALVLVSEAGGMLDRAAQGRIARFDRRNETRRVLYPREGAPAATPTPGWGDPACPGEPGDRLNPHGIDLARLPDGRRRLLVVNHGGRESVELFEVTGHGSALAVRWRGCAVAPAGLFLNDVVNLPDGGFLATHMFTGHPVWGVLRSRLGRDTGAVYEWQAPAAWRAVPGTDAPFPNGIELSGDGREIYLDVYSSGEVRRIARDSGELLAVARVPRPDNSSWARDGRLLVASHRGGLADEVKCWHLAAGACPMAFAIVALDPATLASTTVFANAGPPMGAATIAVDLGDEWLLGSFAGDRLLRVAR